MDTSNSQSLLPLEQKKIIQNIKNMMNNVKLAKTCKEKTFFALNLFNYISKENILIKLNSFKFTCTVKNRLIRLYYLDNVKEAYKIYRDIFKKRIPFMTIKEALSMPGIYFNNKKYHQSFESFIPKRCYCENCIY